MLYGRAHTLPRTEPTMTGEVISHLTVSLDGFGAGRNQRLERRFGDELGEELHDWFLTEPEKHEAASRRGGSSVLTHVTYRRKE